MLSAKKAMLLQLPEIESLYSAVVCKEPNQLGIRMGYPLQ